MNVKKCAEDAWLVVHGIHLHKHMNKCPTFNRVVPESLLTGCCFVPGLAGPAGCDIWGYSRLLYARPKSRSQAVYDCSRYGRACQTWTSGTILGCL